MEKFELTFKVAMNEEERKFGNLHEVSTTILADSEAIQKYMKKAAAVWIQQQIRTNWDLFMEKGVPEKVTLDVPIWSKKTLSVEAGKAKLRSAMAEMTMEEKLAFLKEQGLL